MFEIDGIVIRTTSFKENDMMVNVVSNNGVKSFLAKGVLKFESKNAPSIQLLNKSHFQLSKSKDGLTLRTGTIINSLFSDETNLSFLVIANLICELTSRIIITNEDA
ncbi:MAG TPA: DNA repair protein RecO, partial [Firmicutes bacterium]|nr:DNA repair protein RecO [Bacillota bacterium]